MNNKLKPTPKTSFLLFELIKIRFFLIILLPFFFTGIALAADDAGMVKTLKGSAEIERAGNRVPISVGTVIFPKDRITTSTNSSVGITLKDNTQFAVGANAQLDLNKFSFNTTSHAGELESTVKRGVLSVISGKVAKANPDAVRFNTGTVTLGVRGTEFIIEAGDE